MPRFKTITVRELRAKLFEIEDQEALVVFTADYGDHSHTPQALPIEGELEEDVALSESAYSSSGWRLRDPDYDSERDEPEGQDKSPRVVVIR